MSTPQPTFRDRDPRTAEPRRPWLAWVVLTAYFAAAATVIVALVRGMWTSVGDFPASAWLQGAVPTDYGSPVRLALAAAVWLSAVVVATVAVTVGYYAWAGYSWTRWAGLVCLAVGGLSFLGNSWGPWCLAGIAVGAALTWLPTMRAFQADWTAVRHPARTEPPVAGPVAYGPLPRYS